MSAKHASVSVLYRTSYIHLTSVLLHLRFKGNGERVKVLEMNNARGGIEYISRLSALLICMRLRFHPVPHNNFYLR
ncbi:hypothetical protein C5167_022281 [Papaver somniferum]|uniref:Uncharacterized protein n=1 Tax=Papaver somniferum TaxID=3469 RepID=A0A4Y7JL61_PAPSO|nr:hypothetical protein C5167_022281 [Papaver somniferum]